MPYTCVIDVLLLLVRDHDVLLALRENTGYADGQWNLPSGKLEDGEHILDALVRETREELVICRTFRIMIRATPHGRRAAQPQP